MGNEKSIVVRGVEIGGGIPKICVPVVETEEDAICEAAAQAKRSAADLVEWRADYFGGVCDRDRVLRLLGKLRQRIGEMPLLFTYRTREEGGAGSRQLSAEEYRELNQTVAESRAADILDVEIRVGKEAFSGLAEAVHEAGGYVLASRHDFGKTPPEEEILASFEQMEAWGADILKQAVMPEKQEDLLTLLLACRRASFRLSRPVVAISMGAMGTESRICGEAVGSAMTFGCMAKASAPGQMDVQELSEILLALHRARAGKKGCS